MATRTLEEQRLAADHARTANWQRWGTYLPARQWGTVREDYSPEGQAWESFPFEMAQYRAYRWGEDGLLGWCDRECRLAFSLSLWNGKDSILKERPFGLSNSQGNHGEDVKELWYYLDATPTYSYAHGLYKYPQMAFPYQDLIDTNAKRTRCDGEYELLDTGIFDEERYFDIEVEYAKRDVEDMLVRVTASNRGPDAAPLTLLPTVTLRNNWSWRDPSKDEEPNQIQQTRPALCLVDDAPRAILITQPSLGRFRFEPLDPPNGDSPILFTENETNLTRMGTAPPGGPRAYSKDAFDRYVVHGEEDAVNPENRGTKAAVLLHREIPAGSSVTLLFRLVREDTDLGPLLRVTDADAQAVFDLRKRETDDFYATRIPASFNDDERNVQRQAFAGLLWTRQFYYYVVEQWLKGDPALPPPSPERLKGRNHTWIHVYARDILSMPDKWEYPWFAAWDTAFHVIPFATIDPEFAKSQLMLLLREWYLNPNGEMPAYEYGFSDVNPPVHAWAAYHIYRHIGEQSGDYDLDFLERVFQKLLLNFTWWVNQTDNNGKTLFGGGFLGLDNIGVFDRSQPLPDNMELIQADGTAWMGFYCSCMLQIAVELAQTRPVYEDIASKFFYHFIAIIDAINTFGGYGLWDEKEGFYFDQISHTGEDTPPIVARVQSIVGIIPIYAIAILCMEHMEKLPGLKERIHWFLKNKPHLRQYVQESAEGAVPGFEHAHFVQLVPKERMEILLRKLLDESEFMSDHGVRSLSRYHLEHPFHLDLAGKQFTVKYEPAESESGLFGGNSNWRGPVWFPVNFLLITALERYYKVYGDSMKVECPTGSGRYLNCLEVAEELERRLSRIFLRDENGRRAVHGDEARYQQNPHWRNLVQFYEYFCGDTGRGCGASHQTGWTAIVIACQAKLHRDRLGML